MMLNWAARYFPVIQVLRRLERELGVSSRTLVEVGSGSHGLATFYAGKVYCIDLAFPEGVPSSGGVRASAAALPLSDRSVDILVSMDTLEHIAAPLRHVVLGEYLRVTRHVVVVGFPCGQRAYELDIRLNETYRRARRARPDWLTEHVVNGFPDADFVEQLLPAGEPLSVTRLANENCRFHLWMMRREADPRWDRIFRIALHRAPRLVEALLSFADVGATYRMIYVITRRMSSAPACPRKGRVALGAHQ